MNYETLVTELDDRGVFYLMLNRPAKHNSISAEMIFELSDAAKSIDANSDVKVVVIGAIGKSFCAGGDLEWMRQQMGASRLDRVDGARKLANMLQIWNTLSKPVIAKVEGNAFGGGVGVISVCDVAFCSLSAKFALTEVKLGLIPATISPYVIAKIGESNARSLFTSARGFDAHTAFRIGLVSQPTNDIDDAVEAEVSAYLQASPRAMADAKALVRSLGPIIDDVTIEGTVQKLADTWETPDAKEGVSAFFEKRKPNWI